MFRSCSTLLAASLAALAACSADPVATSASAPVVLSVLPAGGATGVSTTSPVVVTFSHPMMQGMEALVVLHEESVTGPLVEGAATWSGDRTTLTFTPAVPLKPATTYVLHLAPAIADAGGERLSHVGCAAAGGRPVTNGMMGGGPGGPGMMGPGWEMTAGAYGMSFTFTTA